MSMQHEPERRLYVAKADVTLNLSIGILAGDEAHALSQAEAILRRVFEEVHNDEDAIHGELTGLTLVSVEDVTGNRYRADPDED